MDGRVRGSEVGAGGQGEGQDSSVAWRASALEIEIQTRAQKGFTDSMNHLI